MWREVSAAFAACAQEYEAWYQGNPLFEAELAALKALGPVPKPSLEIGVGPGVFAEALGFSHGLDPSLEMLRRARKRGIKVVAGVGEDLPFKDGSFSACGLFFTLCFVEDPLRVLAEARRVLKREGLLYLGVVPADSPWGEFYQAKKRAGHRLYRLANFLTQEKVLSLAQGLGLKLERAFSSLFQSPLGSPTFEAPQEGIGEGAGFLALLFKSSPPLPGNGGDTPAG